MNIKIEHDKNDHIVSLYLEVDLVKDSQYARNWDIDDALKEIDDSGTYNDVVNPIHINQSWVHFEKHPFYSALNEHLSVSEVKSIFGIFD